MSYLAPVTTYQLNSRNKAIEKFASSLLKNTPKAYRLGVCRLNNFFNIIHLCFYQISLPSLPHSPTTLILFLLTTEITVILLMAIPFFTHFRLISWLDFSSKITRFLCIGTVLISSLFISLTSESKGKKPVEESLQNIGINAIIAGMGLCYIFTIVKGMILLIGVVKTFYRKRRK